MSKPIQIVSDTDEPISVASKETAHTEGLMHRIARIMVEDTEGRVLLQLRTPDRKLFPNCWDDSAAGHVDAGETYEIAAKRELAEEIGLKGVDLTEIGYYQTHGKFEWRQLNRFNKLYRVVVPGDITFSIQAEEVARVKWFTVAEAKALVAEHPGQVADGLVEVLERFY